MPRGGKTTPHPPEVKAEALRLHAEVGAKEAAQRLGLPRSTVEAWVSKAKPRALCTYEREGGQGTPLHNSRQISKSEDPFEQDRKTIAEARATADILIAQVQKLGSRSKGVQSTSVAAAVMLDKALLLQDRVAAAESHREALSEHHAEIIANLISMLWESLGAPLSNTAKTLLSKMLRDVQEGKPVVADPLLAAKARAELFEHVGNQIREQLVEEVRRDLAPTVADARGLPVPTDNPVISEDEVEDVAGDVVPDEWGGPVQRWVSDPAPAAIMRTREPKYSESEFG